MMNGLGLVLENKRELKMETESLENENEGWCLSKNNKN